MASVVDGSFTYYRNTLVYEDDSVLPTKMFHPEGFVALNVMQGQFQYKYFKRDHLGSVRALLAETDGELIEEQKTDYYPFGEVHGQYENLHLNRYLFSGKELQDATIGSSGLLGWYDFGARHYNPQLGHWMAPDLLKQFANPYLYCANSPANFVDPTGLTAYTNIDGKLGLYDDPYGIYNDFDVIFFGHTGPSGGVLYDSQYLLGPNIKIRFGVDNIKGSGGGLNFTFPNPSDYGHGVPIPGQGMGGGGGDGGGGGGRPDPYTTAFQMTLPILSLPTDYLKYNLNSLGSNGKIYRPTVNGKVFTGNQPTTTIRIGKAAKGIGKGISIIGIGITGFQVYQDIDQGHPVRGVARLVYSTATMGAVYIPYIGPFVALGMSSIDIYYGDQMYQWVEDNIQY